MRWGEQDQLWLSHIQAAVTECVEKCNHRLQSRNEAEIYRKCSRGRGEMFEPLLLAKVIHIHKVSATPVPALKIMPIGPRENTAVIITEWLKSLHSRKKAGLEEQGFSSWLHEQLSYRSTFISRDNAPEVAKTIRRMQRRERSYTSKTVAAGSRFCCFMKNPWFFLQVEVVKENNQTSCFLKKSHLYLLYVEWGKGEPRWQLQHEPPCAYE